jgi:hypothetical protein
VDEWQVWLPTASTVVKLEPRPILLAWTCYSREDGWSDVASVAAVLYPQYPNVLDQVALADAIEKVYAKYLRAFEPLWHAIVTGEASLRTKEERAAAAKAKPMMKREMPEPTATKATTEASEKPVNNAGLKPSRVDTCDVCTRPLRGVSMGTVQCAECRYEYHAPCVGLRASTNASLVWFCSDCLNRTSADYSFVPSDSQVTVRAFRRYSDGVLAEYFGLGEGKRKRSVALREIESAFWDIVENGRSMVVEYGSDLHSSKVGSGFPTRASVARLEGKIAMLEAKAVAAAAIKGNLSSSSKRARSASATGSTPDVQPEMERIRERVLELRATLAAQQKVVDHPWNLNNLPVDKSSLLPHVNAEVSGMVIPWVYVGSAFSAFAWHTEDHFSPSINYMHTGAPKQWYGVPGDAATKLEEVLRKVAPEVVADQPDLVFQLVTVLSPAALVAAGVPVYSIVQNPGEFVVTSPAAYHSGFNYGFNIAEAVNFLPADWLPYGRACTLRYASWHKAPVFSHDRLVLRITEQPDLAEEPRTASWVAAAAEQVVADEEKRRAWLDDANVSVVWHSSGHAWHVDDTPEGIVHRGVSEDDLLCVRCSCVLFLSAYTCVSCVRNPEAVTHAAVHGVSSHGGAGAVTSGEYAINEGDIKVVTAPVLCLDCARESKSKALCECGAESMRALLRFTPDELREVVTRAQTASRTPCSFLRATEPTALRTTSIDDVRLLLMEGQQLARAMDDEVDGHATPGVHDVRQMPRVVESLGGVQRMVKSPLVGQVRQAVSRAETALLAVEAWGVEARDALRRRSSADVDRVSAERWQHIVSWYHRLPCEPSTADNDMFLRNEEAVKLAQQPAEEALAAMVECVTKWNERAAQTPDAVEERVLWQVLERAYDRVRETINPLEHLPIALQIEVECKEVGEVHSWLAHARKLLVAGSFLPSLTDLFDLMKAAPSQRSSSRLSLAACGGRPSSSNLTVTTLALKRIDIATSTLLIVAQAFGRPCTKQQSLGWYEGLSSASGAMAVATTSVASVRSRPDILRLGAFLAALEREYRVCLPLVTNVLQSMLQADALSSEVVGAVQKFDADASAEKLLVSKAREAWTQRQQWLPAMYVASGGPWDFGRIERSIAEVSAWERALDQSFLAKRVNTTRDQFTAGLKLDERLAQSVAASSEGTAPRPAAATTKCPCRRTRNDVVYLQCVNCLRWCHADCVAVEDPEAVGNDWLCPMCCLTDRPSLKEARALLYVGKSLMFSSPLVARLTELVTVAIECEDSLTQSLAALSLDSPSAEQVASARVLLTRVSRCEVALPGRSALAASLDRLRGAGFQSNVAAQVSSFLEKGATRAELDALLNEFVTAPLDDEAIGKVADATLRPLGRLRAPVPQDGLYCTCRREDDASMIQCQCCNDWFHCSCVGMTNRAVEAINDRQPFVCPVCRDALEARAATVKAQPVQAEEPVAVVQQVVTEPLPAEPPKEVVPPAVEVTKETQVQQEPAAAEQAIPVVVESTQQ